MDIVKTVINENSKHKTNFIVDLRKSDATVGRTRPLDHAITNKGIQTIIHRYHFADHLNDDTYDEDAKACALPENITKAFHVSINMTDTYPTNIKRHKN